MSKFGVSFFRLRLSSHKKEEAEIGLGMGVTDVRKKRKGLDSKQLIGSDENKGNLPFRREAEKEKALSIEGRR